MVDLSTFSNNVDATRFEQTMQSTRTAGVKKLYLSDRGIPKQIIRELVSTDGLINEGTNTESSFFFTKDGLLPAYTFIGNWDSNTSQVLVYFEPRIEPAPPPPEFFTGGDSIFEVEDGGITYKVHKFESSGTLTCVADTAKNVEFIVVGGGGSGGSFGGGGGGGAGVLNYSGSFPVGSASITIGAGGVVGGASSPGNPGQDSEVAYAGTTLLAKGGEGGGGGNSGLDDGGSSGTTFINGVDQNSGFTTVTAGGCGAGGGSITSNGADGLGVTGFGNATLFGAGGGGAKDNGTTVGGATGGGSGGDADSDVIPPDANVGAGGGATWSGAAPSSTYGGSGVVYVRYEAP